MKKIVLALPVMIILVVMIGADIERSELPPVTSTVQKKPCYGYTIIEFGKGINCNGDTIKLVKVNGGQQLMQQEEQNPELTAEKVDS
jgi:hypothetical protein